MDIYDVEPFRSHAGVMIEVYCVYLVTYDYNHTCVDKAVVL